MTQGCICFSIYFKEYIFYLQTNIYLKYNLVFSVYFPNLNAHAYKNMFIFLFPENVEKTRQVVWKICLL